MSHITQQTALAAQISGCGKTTESATGNTTANNVDFPTKPSVSVIIPCFNAANTLCATLDSLIAQTLPDWEAICVDDRSTDATRAIITRYANTDRRITLANNIGKGPSLARNLGASTLSTAPILAFCDADDLWMPNKLAEAVRALTDTDQPLDAVYGQIAFFQNSVEDAHTRSTVPAGLLSIDQLLGENPVCTMSNIVLKRACFAQSGGFDPSMVHNEDLEWLIRLIGNGARIQGLDWLQTFYRTRIGGLSTDLAAMADGRRRAMNTAARFGVRPSRRSHAVHRRYLARRALRLGASRTNALRHALVGLSQSPAGFLTPARRGVPTLLGALGAVCLPRRLSHALFSR